MSRRARAHGPQRHRSTVMTASMAMLVLAAMLLGGGCPGDGKSLVDAVLDDDDGDDDGVIPPTLAAIQKSTFSRICTNCHVPAGSGPMPLDSVEASYANLVNVPSIEVPLLRVAPGDPDNSYLLHKVTAAPTIAGDRMPPPPEPALSQAEIDAIREWIALGANP